VLPPRVKVVLVAAARPAVARAATLKWVAAASPPMPLALEWVACDAASPQKAINFCVREEGLQERLYFRWRHLGGDRSAMVRSNWMDAGDHKNGRLGRCRREICDQFVLIDG
jgi:hypothetical protein